MNKKIKFNILSAIFCFILSLSVFGCSKQEASNTKKHTNKTKVEGKKQGKQENEIREFKKEPLIYNDKRIPVLMYHSIDYEKGNELRLPKEKFKEQMKYLKDNGYTTLSLDELYNFLVHNKPVPEKSIVITLDDGYVDNYENAYPIIKEFGFKAAIFDVTSNIDKNPKTITSKQIKEMNDNGITIASHTVNHDQLDILSYEKQLETMKKSKEDLEKILGKKVNYIAYPYGKWNKDTLKAAKEAGYTMAFTTDGSWSGKDDGIYGLNRVYISGAKGIDDFKYRISNPNYNKVK
ncbi:polysaccharide deacetylase family protein [Clostridium niameyense]|uniref:Polysaccharide deacetylase family protein n=1 Tax=Clostridium niameyense TaxID=1622073 RepID=A0A6M0RDK3_9CLOT|nr:polysaccharide deacetylase family protein [Clostridium niameyense]NEZ47358.1 polysaccharide deacetylase family protein [Clostridium niameyense]